MGVTVELHRVAEGETQYRAVAKMTAKGDQWELEDPDELFPVDLPVLVVEDGEVRHIELASDPERWARNLGSILRTGYLVPIVVADDS